MRTTSRLVAAAALILSTAGGVAGAAGPAHAAAATCDGRPVTLTGASGTTLTGTGGPDVIATGGSSKVYALGGDDTVCVTGRRQDLKVYAGTGDDHVDTTAFTGRVAFATLGPGDDTFVGGASTDDVTTSSPDTTRNQGHDTVDTGDGDDSVTIGPGARGLYDGGPGTNNISFSAYRSPSDHGDHGEPFPGVEVDLPGGTVTGSDGSVAHTPNMTDADVANVLVATVTGTAADNGLYLDACRVRVAAGAGDDHVEVVNYTRPCRGVDGARTVAHGGPGDDTMNGIGGDDLLVGGPGTDRVDGKEGTDTCSAETQTRCERSV